MLKIIRVAQFLTCIVNLLYNDNYRNGDAACAYTGIIGLSDTGVLLLLRLYIYDYLNLKCYAKLKTKKM